MDYYVFFWRKHGYILSAYKSIEQVDAYESKKQELMAENTDLRALLRTMQVVQHCWFFSVVLLYKDGGANHDFLWGFTFWFE